MTTFSLIGINPSDQAVPGKARHGDGGFSWKDPLMHQSAETLVDPETGERLEKILIELQPDHWSGEGGERLWAKPLDDGLYEIRNTPWYAYDVSWGDVVRCEGMFPADLPIVAEVVRSAGHLTVRIFFDEVEAAERERILEEINRKGATYENAGGTRCALDVEPTVNPEALLDYLAVHEEAGHLAWDSGWS